jgi:hypothetical protein
MPDETTVLEDPNPLTTVEIRAKRESITAEAANAALDQRYNKTGNPPKGQPTSKGAEDFKSLRESRDKAIEEVKTFRKTAEERASEIETLKKQIADFDGTRKEYETLKGQLSTVEQERDTYKKVQSRGALEATPEYQKKFVTDREAAVSRATEAADAANVDKEALVSALAKKGKPQIQALNELLSGVDTYARELITQEVRTINGIDAERAQALENADVLMKSRTEEQTAAERRQQEERSKVRAQAWQETSARLKTELGLDDKTVETAHENFRSNRDAGKAAEAILKAAHYDTVKAERDALKIELAKFVKADPGAATGDHRQPGPKKETRAELIKEWAETRGRRV